MMKHAASTKSADGFTLVELLVSALVSLVVLFVAGSLLVTGLRTQNTVQNVTNASTTAQQIARSVQSGVRNATAVTVISDATAGTQLLLARTVSGDPVSTAASCQAWYYTPANGGAIYTTKTTPASAISLPAGGPQGVWTLLGIGVSPSDPVIGKVFNAPSGSRVDLSLEVSAGANPYVLIATSTYTPSTTTVSTPCF
jgi:type II secretory pathway pseudopilin PulG